jgi:hypothetical protein
MLKILHRETGSMEVPIKRDWSCIVLAGKIRVSDCGWSPFSEAKPSASHKNRFSGWFFLMTDLQRFSHCRNPKLCKQWKSMKIEMIFAVIYPIVFFRCLQWNYLYTEFQFLLTVDLCSLKSSEEALNPSKDD